MATAAAETRSADNVQDHPILLRYGLFPCHIIGREQDYVAGLAPVSGGISSSVLEAVRTRKRFANLIVVKMIKHPYYPVEAIVPNYTANNLPRSSLLATAVTSCAVLVGTTVLAAKRLNPKLNLQDLAIITWFVICTRLEVVSPRSLADSGSSWRFSSVFRGLLRFEPRDIG